MAPSQNNRILSSRLVLWLWSISFLSVVGPSAACQGVWQLGLEMKPEGLVKVRHGNALDLLCFTTDGRSTADDIEFGVGGTSVASEKINSTTRRLYIENPDLGLFSYFCLNKETKKHCSSRVIVGTPPVDVADFACISYNIDELNCSWTSYSITKTKYSLASVINGQRTDPCVTQKSSFDKSSCLWSYVSVPRYRQMEQVYHFVLSSSNIFGEHEQNFTINHASIVKPAPVRDLKILGISTYSVLLQWKIPNNMIDFLPVGLQHKIEYRIVDDQRNTSNFRRVEASSLPKKNSTYNFNITLPKAHMQYEVRIYIRPETAAEKQYWSEHSSIFFYTNGKSVQEINKSIYENWKRNMKKPLSSFDKKMWHMKAQKALYKIWRPARNGPLAVLSQLMPDTRSGIQSRWQR